MTISKLYVERQALDSPVTSEFQSRLDIPLTIVSDASAVYDAVAAAPDPIQAGKETLYLTRNRGAFIRACPGTRHYRCCDYQILHIGTFCTMDCAYCILQAYFHPPVLQFFVNQEDMMAELDTALAAKTSRRIGTGEFTDSRIWDLWVDVSSPLIRRFAEQSHAVLELKTKTVHIDGLKHLRHRRKTIMAWSVNTDAVIRENERGTASLDARLRAAARCESWGYPLAFHFDPMVVYEGCESDYREVITRIFDHVSADNIVWISLGTFRFMPSLKPIVQRRFPDSGIVYGEMIPGLDDKMRYFKPIRLALYREIVSWIRSIAPDVTVYFCMEDDDVWRRTMGFTPEEVGGLPEMLDRSAIAHCDLTTES